MSSLFLSLAKNGTLARLVLKNKMPSTSMAPMRMSSSEAKKGFNKANLINIVGLPAVAFVLFVLLPTFTPGEIHSIDYYDKKFLQEQREKEAAKRAAAGN